MGNHTRTGRWRYPGSDLLSTIGIFRGKKALKEHPSFPEMSSGALSLQEHVLAMDLLKEKEGTK